MRGVCLGASTIRKNLTIVGRKPKHAVKPTLVGRKTGSVLIIARGKTAVIKKLKVSGGSGAFRGCPPPDTCAGGIWNKGDLALFSVHVRDNDVTGREGGIFNSKKADSSSDPKPKLTLKGRTILFGNVADQGGAIYGQARSSSAARARSSTEAL